MMHSQMPAVKVLMGRKYSTYYSVNVIILTNQGLLLLQLLHYKCWENCICTNIEVVNSEKFQNTFYHVLDT